MGRSVNSGPFGARFTRVPYDFGDLSRDLFIKGWHKYQYRPWSSLSGWVLDMSMGSMLARPKRV